MPNEAGKVAALLPDEVDRIVADPDMIRNRRKIEATIKNAQAILKVQEEFGSFANYLWQFVKTSPFYLFMKKHTKSHAHSFYQIT